jgi:hypothetical protein
MSRRIEMISNFEQLYLGFQKFLLNCDTCKSRSGLMGIASGLKRNRVWGLHFISMEKSLE